ncbi:MAG: hypothetical protein ACREJC_08085 [Tepidisphaeraceae bacterium]
MSLIDDYCDDAITIQPKGTVGADGRYPYNVTPVATSARVQREVGTLMKPPGVQVEFTHVMWVRPEEAIWLEDHIVYATRTYTVLAIAERDFLGGEDNHKKVYCA